MNKRLAPKVNDKGYSLASSHSAQVITMPTTIFSPFTLASGGVIKNRLVKAAMEENLATRAQVPGKKLLQLYKTWAEGGVGLIITGNVMVDHLAMTGPGGLALEQDTDLTSYRALASAAKANNTKVWMQINHPGRQVFKKMGGKVLSASNIPLDMGKYSALFTQPKALEISEIEDIIKRFVSTAKQAEKAGFDGVQIHGAHGYLLAQFLSPLTNKREDEWGGSLRNRARLLLEISKAIRGACGPGFAVSVKLNSADFQQGGFDVNDAQSVVQLLAELSVDLVELSGGSYEVPAMQGRTGNKHTLAKEAYFLEFARGIASNTSMAIMTTGGISKRAVAEHVVESGIELVGLASALAFTPQLPNQWMNRNMAEGKINKVRWRNKTLSGLANMALVKGQLRRIGADKLPNANASPLLSLLLDRLRTAHLTKRYRRQFTDQLDQ
ncbi:MAG: 2,4-dienoyl-CoA reductase-like NADH-dependent reductase (Old Yellow Enzyme family) [Paraglaciecola sp.]